MDSKIIQLLFRLWQVIYGIGVVFGVIFAILFFWILDFVFSSKEISSQSTTHI